MRRIANPLSRDPSPAVPVAVADYLIPSERSVLVVRRHPAMYLPDTALLICACIGASLLTALTNSGAIAIGAAWAACAVILLGLLARLAYWLETYFVATDIRLMIITGPVPRKVVTIHAREIRELEFRRSLMGRLLGYAAFNAIPAKPGTRLPRMKYMPYPDHLFIEIVNQLSLDWNVHIALSATGRTEFAMRSELLPEGPGFRPT